MLFFRNIVVLILYVSDVANNMFTNAVYFVSLTALF